MRKASPSFVSPTCSMIRQTRLVLKPDHFWHDLTQDRESSPRQQSSPVPQFFGTYLLNQRMPIYHREGQLRILYLVRSVPGPNSAFLWKTAVILIDEIQRCPKQSGRSPTVAHRRGAPLLSLFSGKKGARPENTRGKNHDFSSKGPEKQRFFTGSGKVQENLFHLQTTTILAWQPRRPKLRETGHNNELIIFLWALNGWCNTSPCIHSICAYRLIVRHVAAESKIPIA